MINLYSISWYNERKFSAFELHYPWWITGERMSDGAQTIVANIFAKSEKEAEQVVFFAYDTRPSKIEWRFNDLLEDRNAYFKSDRFPISKWMLIYTPEELEEFEGKKWLM